MTYFARMRPQMVWLSPAGLACFPCMMRRSSTSAPVEVQHRGRKHVDSSSRGDARKVSLADSMAVLLASHAAEEPLLMQKWQTTLAPVSARRMRQLQTAAQRSAARVQAAPAIEEAKAALAALEAAARGGARASARASLRAAAAAMGGRATDESVWVDLRQAAAVPPESRAGLGSDATEPAATAEADAEAAEEEEEGAEAEPEAAVAGGERLLFRQSCCGGAAPTAAAAGAGGQCAALSRASEA